MTVTFSLWWIPTALTVIVVALGFLWPVSRSGGDYYGIGAAFDALLICGGMVFAILLIWLTAFAVAAFA